jgi:hypothetical protein
MSSFFELWFFTVAFFFLSFLSFVPKLSLPLVIDAGGLLLRPSSVPKLLVKALL